MSNDVSKGLPIVEDAGAIVARSLASLLVVPQGKVPVENLGAPEVFPMLSWIRGSTVSFADSWYGLSHASISPTLIAVSLFSDSPPDSRANWQVFNTSAFGRRLLSREAVVIQYDDRELDELHRVIPWGDSPAIISRREIPPVFCQDVTQSAIGFPVDPQLSDVKEVEARMIVPSGDSESLRLRLATSLLETFSRWIRFNSARRIGRPIR